MQPKSRKLLNTIKTYLMSPIMSCELDKLAIRNQLSEAELVRNILAMFIEALVYG